MAEKYLSITSPNGATINAQVERGRQDNEFSIGKLIGDQEVLIAKVPKVREQCIRGPKGSLIVGMVFYPRQPKGDLEVFMGNPDYSNLNPAPSSRAVDPYTNIYTEYPARFVLLADFLDGREYEASVSSDYRGDFLELEHLQSPRGCSVIVINLWAVFMFDYVEVNTRREVVYHDRVMRKFGVNSQPFFSHLRRPSGCYERAEAFKTRSWKLAHAWAPHMQAIQFCEGIHFGDRLSNDEVAAVTKMREYIKKLPSSWS